MIDPPHFNPGLPRHAFAGGGAAIYEILIDDGQIIRAYMDLSQQYSAEGIQWRNARTNECWPRHRVRGWREINAETQA